MSFGATLFGEHGPAEANRMIFGHIRTLDNNAIRIRQILQRRGCSASAK